MAEILHRYYETSIQVAKRWIDVGIQNGAIPATIDSEKVARMFTVFKNGLQVQHLLAPGGGVDEKEIYGFMAYALGGN